MEPSGQRRTPSGRRRRTSLLSAAASTLGEAASDPVGAADSGSPRCPLDRPSSSLPRRRAQPRHRPRAASTVTSTPSMCSLRTSLVPARSVGGTLNDAFLAAVVGGFARYHERHGARGELRVTMPINVRRDDDERGGNRFTPARFSVPVDIDDPAARHGSARRDRPELAPRARHRAHGRAGRRAEPLARCGDDLDLRIDAQGRRLRRHQRARHRGSAGWLAGAEVLQLYGFGPTSGAAVSFALVSHLDVCCIGINVDTVAIPDPEVLLTCLQRASPRSWRSAGDARRASRSPRLRRRPSATGVAGERRPASPRSTPASWRARRRTTRCTSGAAGPGGGTAHRRARPVAHRATSRPRSDARLAPLPAGCVSASCPCRWAPADRSGWTTRTSICPPRPHIELAPPGSREQLEALLQPLQMQLSTGRGRCGRCGSWAVSPTARSGWSTRSITPSSTASRRPRRSSCCWAPDEPATSAPARRWRIRRAAGPVRPRQALADDLRTFGGWAGASLGLLHPRQRWPQGSASPICSDRTTFARSSLAEPDRGRRPASGVGIPVTRRPR